MALLDAAAGTAARIGAAPLDRIRSDFPILGRRLDRGGETVPLVYLDNAASSQKPRRVLDAMDSFYVTSNANVHRSLHTLGEEATAAYEAARGTVARFLGARDPAEVVFTRGATESINLVASSWGRKNLAAGDRILLTEMEHHSNLVPWQLVAAERGAVLDFVPIDSQGCLDMAELERRLGPRTRLVALTGVSNVLGTVNDVKAIASAAHRHGAVVLVDAAQAAPHLALDVGDLGCDFLAFSGHKTYGPMGIGVLWGRERLLEEMPPYMGGGEMIRAVWLDHSTWNDLPYKFEAGTPNVAGAVGLGAALEYLDGLGLAAVGEHERALTTHGLEVLAGIPRVTVHGRAPDRAGVLSFSVPDIHPHDLAQYLDTRGIAIRAGHHCAQPLMRRLGVSATARASLALYNTPEEIDVLGRALREALEYFGHAP
jgi:cysteine desulfurase/selenocysteine lyase